MSTTKYHWARPWIRADALLGSSLYWLGVSQFPCRTAEKGWARAFLQAFDQEMQKTLQCRVEIFVHRRTLFPDLMDPFLLHARKLNPIPGLMQIYGEPLRKAPHSRDIERMVGDGEFDKLTRMGTDIGWWFARKNPDEQRSMFLGQGGMVHVWLPPDAKTAPPELKIAPKVRSHPAFAGLDLEGTRAVTYSLADSFLPNSLKIFAPDIKEDPQYQGYPFALPMLNSQDIMTVTGELRSEWLKLAPCYFFESPTDRGFLLWGVPEIDEPIKMVLEAMREQGLEYPAL